MLPADAHPVHALRGSLGSALAGRAVGLGVDACRGAPGAVRIARELARWGAEVQALVRPTTERWVPLDALEYATGHAPRIWDLPPRPLDAVLLAPAAAESLRKVRLGLADSALTAGALDALRRGAPVLAAAAPGTRAGEAAKGIVVVEEAFDAHGEPRPEMLAARVAGALSDSPLRGRRVLLLAGGGFEPMDAMRVLASHGDGAVARALCLELMRRGAAVEALAGPWAWHALPGARRFASRAELGPLLATQNADLVVAEDALPGRTTPPQKGKLPSGQAGLRLRLDAAPGLDALLRDARSVRYQASPGEPPAAQATRIATQAEQALSGRGV